MRAVLTFLFLLMLALPGETFAAFQQGFFSPKGKFEVVITPVGGPGTGRAAYRMDFLDILTKAPVKSIIWTDVKHPMQGGPQPASIFYMLIWSPNDDFIILPDDNWQGLNGPNPLKAIAIDRSLAWGEIRLTLQRLTWLDDYKAIGDYKADCAYGVDIFDGLTGQTTPLKAPESPIGYELVRVEIGDKAIVRQIPDNCSTGRHYPVICRSVDIATGAEAIVSCLP